MITTLIIGYAYCNARGVEKALTELLSPTSSRRNLGISEAHTGNWDIEL